MIMSLKKKRCAPAENMSFPHLQSNKDPRDYIPRGGTCKDSGGKMINKQEVHRLHHSPWL